jgi:hypothetical protein
MPCRPVVAQPLVSVPAAANDGRAGIVVAVRSGQALDELERRVVLLSRRDPRPAGRIGRAAARAAHILFGGRETAGLADPRLEALRRFAVLLRIGGGHVASVEIERFVAAGFAEAQIDAVWMLCADRIPAARDRAARVRRLRLIVALWAGVLPPVALALADHFGDGLIGTTGAALLFATGAPITARIG